MKTPTIESSSADATRYPFAVQYYSEASKTWEIFDFCATQAKAAEAIRNYRRHGARERYRVASVQYIDEGIRLPAVTDSWSGEDGNQPIAVMGRLPASGWTIHEKVDTVAEGNRAIDRLNAKYGTHFQWHLARIEYV